MSKRKTSTAAHHRKQHYHVHHVNHNPNHVNHNPNHVNHDASREAQPRRSKRKTTNLVLLSVLLLPLIGGGLYLLTVGPQAAGILLLALAAAALVWLWKF